LCRSSPPDVEAPAKATPVAATKSASTALSANVGRMKAPFGPANGLEEQTDREANARTDGSRR
jgi:hypothetical protein